MKVQKNQTLFLKFLLFLFFLVDGLRAGSQYELQTPQQLFQKINRSLKKSKKQHKQFRKLNETSTTPAGGQASGAISTTQNISNPNPPAENLQGLPALTQNPLQDVQAAENTQNQNLTNKEPEDENKEGVPEVDPQNSDEAEEPVDPLEQEMLNNPEIANFKVSANPEDLTLKELELKEPEIEVPDFLCNPEVLLTIGFEPRIEPLEVQLAMCPRVKKSCCSVKDQEVIFKNYIEANEGELIKERFEWYIDTYSELFDNLKVVDKWAKRSLDFLKTKQVSNCKILASRLTAFQIHDIAPDLIDQLRFMYEYLEHYFKGFYCAMCNAENHQFIDVSFNTITFPVSSCRMTVQKSLFPLMYLQLYFNEYLNIVTKFMDSCTYKGKFVNEVTHKDQKFTITKKHKTQLTECFKYRNKPDWFNRCKFICEDAGIISIADEFFPRFKKYKKYSEYLEKKLKIWKGYEDEYQIFQKLQDFKNRNKRRRAYRVLEEEETEKKKESPLEAINMKKVFKVNNDKKFADKNLFMFGIQPLFNFKKVKKLFSSVGIDFYQESKKSQITKDTMQIVKMDLEKLKKPTRKLLGNESKFIEVLMLMKILLLIFYQLNFKY